jgi:hypothetical protein
MMSYSLREAPICTHFAWSQLEEQLLLEKYPIQYLAPTQIGLRVWDNFPRCHTALGNPDYAGIKWVVVYQVHIITLRQE